MQKLIEWFTANWATIVIVLGVLVTILNAATQVWHEKVGAVRILQFIASCLSLVRSKGADPGPLGALKLPLVPELPPKSGRGGLIGSVLLVMIVALGGCCASAQSPGQCYVLKAIKVTEKVDLAALPEIEKQCAPAVEKCGKVKPADCPAYVTCEKILLGYKTGMNAAGRGLEAVNKALIDARGIR